MNSDVELLGKNMSDRDNLINADIQSPAQVYEKIRPYFEMSWKPIVLTTAINWFLIIAGFWIVNVFKHPVVTITMALVIGNRYYVLFILGHDGYHRRLFKRVWLNDLFCDLLLIGPLGGITRVSRLSHLEHHRLFPKQDDPDRFKYTTADKMTRLQFLSMLTGITFFTGRVRNVFFYRKNKGSREDSHVNGGWAALLNKYKLHEVLVLLLWLVLFPVVLTLAIDWWAYPVLWVFPVIFVTFNFDNMRVFCEHSDGSQLHPEKETFVLACYEPGWVERQLFAPACMNYHGLHHAFPHIPCHQLPAAARVVKNENLKVPLVEWRDSYIGYLLDYWKGIKVLF